MSIHRISFPLLISLVSAPCLAQCVCQWDATLGTPGVTSDGYIQPMLAWNPGNGEKLFVGGSFNSIGGWLTRGIAQYDPATQSWGAVGNGAYSPNTNYFVTSLAVHRFGSADELVVGGGYATASNVPSTQNLARWDGTRWASIGGGSPAGAVWTLASWQGRLYVGGGFANIGSSATPASGNASWDGSAWSAVGTGMNGGFSPAVFSMKAFNDGSGEKLYVGGRFASIGGVSGLIGRWTGSAWQPVGGGVAPGDANFSDIECMEVFNDGTGPALYVGGWTLRPFQSVNCSVAKWNGTRWTAVGQFLGGRTTSLAVFDDGTGPALYAGGTAQPGINYIAKLVNNQWVILDGGVGQPGGPPWPSVFGLYNWNGNLVVGGDFDYAGASTVQVPASGIVVRTACPPCRADFNNDSVVDLFDYLDYVAAFAASGPGSDFNADTVVDFFDYLDFVAAFAQGC